MTQETDDNGFTVNVSPSECTALAKSYDGSFTGQSQRIYADAEVQLKMNTLLFFMPHIPTFIVFVVSGVVLAKISLKTNLPSCSKTQLVDYFFRRSTPNSAYADFGEFVLNMPFSWLFGWSLTMMIASACVAFDLGNQKAVCENDQCFTAGDEKWPGTVFLFWYAFAVVFFVNFFK
jgi:hypothetical protein